MIAYLSPLEGEDPFAGIRMALACAPGELPNLDGIPLGPRTSHDPRRGADTLIAYRQWVARGAGADAAAQSAPTDGSQALAFVGDPAWSPQRRFERVFERLAIAGFARMGRYELLVTLGRLGLYELLPDALHLAGARGLSSEDLTTLAAKRVFGIGDPLLLERRAAALAQAIFGADRDARRRARQLALARAGHARLPAPYERRRRVRARRRRAGAVSACCALRPARGPAWRLGARQRCRPHGRLQCVAKLFRTPRESLMPLCFIQPQDAIRVIAESVGREARRQLVGEVVRAWVDDIPDQELSVHYAKAIADLDEDDLHLLAAWHASLEVGQPIPNTDFLVGVFPSLGENRREALKIAAGFRGEEAFQAGVAEDQALDTVLPRLSSERAIELANECIQLYMWDRLGCDN